MKYFEVIFRTNYCGSDENHYITANNEKEVNDWAEEHLTEFINDNEDDAMPDYERRMEEEGIPEDEWDFYESVEYENYRCDCGYDITEIPVDEKDNYASEWEEIN